MEQSRPRHRSGWAGQRLQAGPRIWFKPHFGPRRSAAIAIVACENQCTRMSPEPVAIRTVGPPPFSLPVT
jgi:hypothetical protein